MKKYMCITITTLLLSLLNYNAKSQLPDGTIAPDFTLVDINGTTHHLYGYLDAGKTVVIDFSAVWCEPCWAYHETGALEDFYVQHGPNGDNTAMVLFIEMQEGTLAQLNGGSGSVGNWVAGTPYPIIPTYAPNGTSITSNYPSNYVPTIYMICAADKKTKLIGQLTVSQLNTAMGTCPPVNVPPIADFSALSTTSCTGSVQFIDQTTNYVTSWLWDFGDGQTSTIQNPSHTYIANGTHTVSLKSTSSYGDNTVIKTNYINIALTPTPTTSGASSNIPASLTLNASGTGTLNWYDVAIGGNLINTGTSYITPLLNNSTTYYVENDVIQAIQAVGRTEKTSGKYFTSDARWALKFNAIAPLTIKTVKVYSGSSGNRTIWLTNSNGVQIDSVVVYIPSGEQIVTLNFNVPVGIDYKLGANSACNLWRDSLGATYPYTVSDLISITGNTATSSASSYYYYFYDWKIQSTCISQRAPVTATINTSGINQIYNANFKVFPNPSDGEFTIFFDNFPNEIDQVTIENSIGQEIYNESIINSNNQITFNFKDLSKGIYFIKSIGKNNVQYNKIIIK